MITGSLWVLDGELTTGGLAACSILSGRLVAPLSALVGIRIKLNSIHSANQAIEKLSSTSVSNSSVSDKAQITSSGLENKDGFKALEIKHATIERYGDLVHLDVTLSKGELVLLESVDRHTNSHLLSSLLLVLTIWPVNALSMGRPSQLNQ